MEACPSGISALVTQCRVAGERRLSGLPYGGMSRYIPPLLIHSASAVPGLKQSWACVQP